MAGLLAVTAFLLVWGCRSLGWLEAVELLVYDQHLRGAAVRPDLEQRVVLVGADEADLNRWGWPLSDAVLAGTIEKLLAQRPAAIGIDLYRDMPREPGHEDLRRVLRDNPQVIAVTKIGIGKETGIPPPAYLGPEQVGFADVPLDDGDVVRRGLLFLDDGENVHAGFALRLALAYLQPRGIGLEPGDPDPSYLKLGRHTIPPFEPSDGGYVDADAGGYQFLLDFAGGAAPFAQLTLGDVLENRVPPGLMDGKVVILGVTSPSVKDFFATPLTHGDTFGHTVFGITLHGHVVSQLLRIALDGDAPIAFWDDGREALWIVFWCLSGCLFSLKVRDAYRFILLLLAGAALIIAVGPLAMRQALWLPTIPPLIAWLLSALLTFGFLSVQERRQRGQLMQLFSRFVSRDVANEIWNRHEEFLAPGGRPQPRKLDVTVLFSDIRGFTSISEHLSAEQLMTWLSMYIEAMTDLVGKHGGMVDKFIGDAVMAIFGAPLPRQRPEEIAADAVQAVECALAMADRVAQLNEDWREQGLPEIAIRIGINTGTVVSGSLGNMERLEFTVIGDAVNIASRLESMDKDWPGLAGGEHCRILVSEATRANLGDRYDTRCMGAVQLKGKQAEVAVFRIMGRVM